MRTTPKKERGKPKMSPERAEALRAELERVNDWAGTCRVCGKVRTGTLAELRTPCDHVKEAPFAQAT